MSLKNKKVLITCGPTWTAIDDMRVISNRSTGEMGHRIAKEMNKAGAKVTMLEGPVLRAFDSEGVKVKRFEYFDELKSLLTSELQKKYDLVVHAAAVSDFKVQNESKTKIKSESKSIRLDLTPTDKLVNLIKRQNPKVKLVGFKLESKLNEEIIKEETSGLFDKARCDWVVANQQRGKQYKGYLVDRKRNISNPINDKRQLVKALIKTLDV